MGTIFWALVAGLVVGYVLGIYVGHNNENFTEE